MDSEEQILSRVEVEMLLARLPPADAEMLVLIWRFYQPAGWVGRWPPTHEQIGNYIGRKYENGSLSEAAIRYRCDQIYAALRGERSIERRPKRRK